MKIPIRKELRSEPKVFGLNFSFFIVWLMSMGAGALWLIIASSLFSFFGALGITAGSYALCMHLSRSEHKRRVDISPDFVFYCDTLAFVPSKKK